MRLVSKRVIKYANPIPVYDVTNEKNHNFTLGNGLVVHNSLRKTDAKVFASNEVVNILGMIGYNPDAEAPLGKMRVGKIILMSDPDPDGPLHGDTQLNVMFEDETHLVTMHELAEAPWKNRPYKVLSWNGQSVVATEAYGCRVTTVADKEVLIKFDDDTKICCAPTHQWCMYSSKTDTRASSTLNVGFHCVQAQRLKVGDRLAKFVPGPNGKYKIVIASITKLKIKTVEDTPYYCLTVPGYHNFALANGVVSKNCHINSLLLTLFAKYMPELFDRHLIYVSMMPQFYAFHKTTKQLFTGSSSKEVSEKVEAAKMKLAVNHIKGLGEVDPSWLRPLAFDPATRILYEVQPWKDSKDRDEFNLIMGESPEGRRKLLDI